MKQPSAGVSIALVVGLAAVVRVWRLTDQSLWMDEWFAVSDAALSLRAIWALGDGEPALHKAVLHVLLAWAGPSDWWARIPSAIAGTLSVWLLFDLGRRWVDTRIGLIAAALLACNPFAVWYAQEARGYSFAMLAALGSTRALGGAVERGTWQAWVVYALWVWFGMGSHYYFVFVVVGQSLIAAYWCFGRGTPWRAVLPGAVLVSIAVLFWVPALASDVGAQTAEDAARGMSLSVVPYTMLAFVGGLSWGPPPRLLQTAMALDQSLGDAIAPYAVSAGVAILLTAVLTVLAAMALRRDRRTIPIALMASAPVLGAWFAGVVLTGFRPRYALTGLPFLLLLWAATMRGARPQLARFALAALLVVQLLAVWQIGDPAYVRDDTRAAAALVRASDPQTTVLLLGEGTSPFVHYSGPEQSSVVVRSKMVAQPRELREFVSSAIAGHSAIVVVAARPWSVDPKGLVDQVLAESMSSAAPTKFAGVEVRRWVRTVPRSSGGQT